MNILLIIGIIWIIGAIISWFGFTSKWNTSMFEKVWFTVLWPTAALLYPIHLINTAIKSKKE